MQACASGMCECTVVMALSYVHSLMSYKDLSATITLEGVGLNGHSMSGDRYK